MASVRGVVIASPILLALALIWLSHRRARFLRGAAFQEGKLGRRWRVNPRDINMPSVENKTFAGLADEDG
jgi:hypothetical protein